MKIFPVICNRIVSMAARQAWRSLVGIGLLALCAGTASAAIGVDKTVSKDQGTPSKTVATAAFSTTSANELLLAFISADGSSKSNTTVSSISGGGLTWTLVRRTNTQLGTAEIWRAFAPAVLTNVTMTATLSASVDSSMTVMSFTGTDTTGTGGSGAIGATGTGNSAKGAPAASLVTTRNNSLVIGVGNDWDNAISRTPATGQTVVHQDLAPVGDTYWVQRQNSTTPASGTTVMINDTAPTTDRYNLTLAEILAPATAVPTITATLGTPQSAMVTATFATALQATVKDSSGNLLSGASVTFTAPATTGPSGTFGGSATATVSTGTTGVATAPAFTADTFAGGYTVTATTTGATSPASFSLSNTAGPPMSVAATAGTPQSATIKTAFTTALQATVKDGNNNPVSGASVVFVAPATGASGTFSNGTTMITVATAATGVASAPFTANAVAGGPYTVTATVSGLTPVNFSLTNNPGAAASITATAGTPQNTMIGSAFTTALQATVTDGSSNPIVGASVIFTAPATGASGTFSNGTATITVLTVTGGVATAAFTANTVAGGPYTVTAKTGTLAAANFSLTNNPGAAMNIAATAGGSQSATINTAFTTALQAKVTDASNNPLSGVQVTFTAPPSGASGTFSNATATIMVATASTGVASAPFTANGTPGGPYLVTASAAGVTGSISFSLTNNALPPANIAATAGTPQNIMIGTAFTTSLQATVTDASSNPVVGASVTFTAPATGASGTFSNGTATITVATDVNGMAAEAFTANTVAGGPYTVTAKTGALAAANFSLTNNPGAASNFTATAGASQSATINTAFATALQAKVTDASNNPLSGVQVTFTAPASGASGTFSNGTATITIATGTSGTASATFTANATPGGPYTVTASASGVTPTASFSLTNNSSAPATLAIDVTTSTDAATAKTTVVTPSFSTKSANELLLAFVSTDEISSPNTTVTGVTGGGLTWVMVYRTNVQSGDAEIWRAFAPATLSGVTVTATLSQNVVSSITVVSFTGADTTGTNGSGAIGATASGNSAKGAPTASLVTTRNGSWVFGVGNDYDNATARTLPTGQTLVHQDLAPTGDTYWVQRQTNTTPTSGTTVMINDTAPTGDDYNLSIVEVLPSTGQVSVPDLTVTKSHTGNFVQGQTGATYTITVTNSGGAATSGTVTLTDTLPASLTAISISGTNWTCTLATLTCTRSDALGAATSYPAITLTVNVSASAPGSVTNTATISGGGETNTSNDTANDVTNIIAAGTGTLVHVGGAAGVPVLTNQVMKFNYTPVGTNDALVFLTGCRGAGVTSMTLTAPGWTITPISGLAGPSAYYDFITTFGAIAPSTNPVTFTVTLTGSEGNCSGNDTTFLVDEFSGNDTTGGLTTFDAHNQSLDTGSAAICTGAPVTPANNNDAIWYACFDNVTGVGGGYVKGQDDGTGDWSEYQILAGGSGVAQSPSFTTNPCCVTFGLGGVSIKPAVNGTGSTYTLSGTITPATAATVMLTASGFTTQTTTANGSTGNYSFSGLSNNTYTVTPSETGLNFSPSSQQNVVVNGSSVTGVNFTTSGAISVSISPKRGGIAINQALPVSAVVTNDVGGAGVMWSASGTACSGATCGTFTNVTTTSATYVAPSTAGIYSIIATSIADGVTSASNSIGVTDLTGVLTYHNDISRDGANTQEYALTTSNVTTSTFGKLFSCQTDGAIYAQPLWIPNVMISNVVHNIVVVATEHDSLYAFDADSTSCTTLWQVSLIDSAHGATAGETSVPWTVVGTAGDLSPEIGVTGTPVIDSTTNTIYVVSKSSNSSNTVFQRLHAISLVTGGEVVAPQNIDSTISVPGTGDGSVGGQLAFNTLTENQRSGLVFSNGVVYVSWGSHEDNDPYHGWVIGFNASTLAPITNGAFNATPNKVGKVSYSRGGVWMGGGAPAVDSSGNLFLITGNGTFDANSGGSNYGDSILKLSTTSGLSVLDYYTPLDQATLDANDTDFGSGAATILVDQPTGPVTHLLIGGGKEGNLFMINRDTGKMGEYSSTSSNNVVQTVNLGYEIFATPVFWQNNLYVAGVGPLVQYTFNPTTGLFNGSPYSQSTTQYAFPGSTPSLSSNGAANGIVWSLDNSQYCTNQSPGCGPAVLHAYNATNLATDLWNSSQAAGSRDKAGDAVKFTVPTVANGKVYVGTRGNNGSNPGELEVYGLLPN